jgi:hypothetical protein
LRAGLKIEGVTLHSYRDAWAERALRCGYPERFAQQASPGSLGCFSSRERKRAFSPLARVGDQGRGSAGDWEQSGAAAQESSEGASAGGAKFCRAARRDSFKGERQPASLGIRGKHPGVGEEG